MKKNFLASFLVLAGVFFCPAASVFAQTNADNQAKSEIAKDEDVPGLIKSLPDYENVGKGAVFILNKEKLQKTLGNRPVFDSFGFAGGTEAATAVYPQGKLLVVEFSTPQFAEEADASIKKNLKDNSPTPPVFYRRIGNYTALVFDSESETAANSLLDQVKYEKDIQWLGINPFIIIAQREKEKQQERDFIVSTSSLFIATVLYILFGFAIAIVGGVIVGLIYYSLRDKKRSSWDTYTDAGGMTRLNLDGFTPEL